MNNLHVQYTQSKHYSTSHCTTINAMHTENKVTAHFWQQLCSRQEKIIFGILMYQAPFGDVIDLFTLLIHQKWVQKCIQQ